MTEQTAMTEDAIDYKSYLTKQKAIEIDEKIQSLGYKYLVMAIAYKRLEQTSNRITHVIREQGRVVSQLADAFINTIEKRERIS